MCGIAGIVDFHQPAAHHEPAVRRMQAALRHRGPDGEGLYLVARMSPWRIPAWQSSTAPAERSPPSSPDGRWTLIYNGEVYNYPELREELRPFWNFRTNGDSEVVLAAFARWGRHCLTRFNGMFAFFLWDEQTKTGFGARDGLGIKPFLYRREGEAFLFASEAKAILQASAAPPAANPLGILEYLTAPCFSGVSRSMFAGIEPLPAGYCFTIDREGLHLQPWWDYRLEPSLPKNDPGVARELLGLLEKATRRALRADVLPGAFLSGGVDSTALAALARREGHRPECFSIRFDQQESFDYARSTIVISDDLPFALSAARELDLPCQVVEVQRANLAEDIDRLARIDDALPAWEQELSQHHLSRAAAKHCKAVLVGDAADETHYGYHFLLDEQATRSPRGIVERYATPWLRSSLLEDPIGTFSAEYENLCRAAGHDWQTPESRMLATTYLIVKRWLARLLHNGDIHTMAFSLEGRVPFGDTELLDFARRVPPFAAFADGSEKALLRQALVGVLPENIRTRKKSALPKDQKTEAVYRREVLRLNAEDHAFLGVFLDLPAVRARCEDSRPLNERERAALYRILCLARWRRHYGIDTP